MSTAALDAPPVTSTLEPAARSREARRVPEWGRVLGACLLLLLVYGCLASLNDPRGALGSDTGGKLATLRVMGDHGGLDVDVGYWAERWDPTGEFHPLYYTSRLDGQWVQVTTLPQLLLAYPLYRLGGFEAVLLLPMAGAVLTALAARALARRMDRGRGWMAFWAVALATPVAIYALDFWEHSLGLGLMAWGAVLLLDVARGTGGWKAAGAGGLLFGLAATMRTEALVPLAVAAAIACIAVLARDRRLAGAVACGGAIAVGAGAALVAEHVLERAVLGVDLRAARATHTAAAAAGGVGERAKEALTTTIGLNGFAPSTSWLIGGLAVVLVGAGAFVLARRPTRATLGVALLVFAAAIYAARLSGGLGFVPGVFTACPLAAAGLFLAWSLPQGRLAALLACLTLPIVWVAQYSGNASPQWGGRYVLLSGVLLAVVAVVALRPAPAALVAVMALSLAVTACGVAWLSERSHTVADGMEALVARHDQAVVSLEGHVLREGGAFYSPARHWLTVTDLAKLPRAVRIVETAGDTEMALLAPAGQRVPARLGPYTAGGRRPLEIRPGERLQVVTYRAPGHDSGSP
ncbi:MAG TPA: hypothetical protein VEP49_07955 [Acidimicrobiia bacterium]|nr:hypothetical protein [Acidimicrobiia bacterium]